MDKILEKFIEEPEREFHVREVARAVKVSPATASQYLKKLAKAGLLTSKLERNHRLYRANAESSNYRDTKIHYNISRIKGSGLVDYLKIELNHPKAIILFGSFRKGDNVPESDIDIFVVAAVKKKLNLSGFEKKLGHPIQLFVYSQSELEKMKLKNRELLNNIG